MRKILLLPITVATLAVSALAAESDKIYKTTDEDGNTVFTNEKPSEDAEPVDLEPLNTVPPEQITDPEASPRDQNQAGGQQRQDQATPRYRGVAIKYPPPGQTVRHNGGVVPFQVETQPAGKPLAEGHRIQVVLDGEVRDSGRKRQISVSAVNRGPHTAEARIVDQDGAAITSSEPVEFTLLRAALGDRANN